MERYNEISLNLDRIIMSRRIMVINFSGSYFIEPPLDTAYKVEPEVIVNRLENLVEEGVLKKETISRPYCPECLSTDLTREYLCPRCHSKRIVKDVIIRHECGYRGPKRAFIYVDKLRCPKCHKELRKEGVDYVYEGVQYKCMDCAHIFKKPLVRYRCKECGAIVQSPPTLVISSYEK